MLNPSGKRFFEHERNPKMHAADINFVGFTAQIYNALYWQCKANGDF